MFLLTYALIAEFGHFYPNINRFYMAIIMAAPMVVIMLKIGMRSMYTNKRLNAILISVFTIIFIGTFVLARTQTPVGNEQFEVDDPASLQAILMCEQGNITDPEIEDLCVDIVEAQEREIVLPSNERNA